MTGAGVLALAGSGALLAACGIAGVPVTPRAASSSQPAAASPARAAGAGEAGSAALTSSRKQAPELPRALAGNPDGGAPVPAAARPVNTARPDQVIGNGTAASCTSGAVVAAVAKSGVITFDCGAKPVTIMMQASAKAPARPGTPGGGSGGAIYNDGDTYHLKVEGTVISGNHAREGGGAIFYVSNDRTGTLLIKKSTLNGNPNDGFFTAGYPGIFFLGQRHPVVISSTIN
jgi:hypothetical protein